MSDCISSMHHDQKVLWLNCLDAQTISLAVLLTKLNNLLCFENTINYNWEMNFPPIGDDKTLLSAVLHVAAMRFFKNYNNSDSTCHSAAGRT